MREVRRLVELRRSLDKQRSRDVWRAGAHRTACAHCDPAPSLSVGSYNIWGVRREWPVRLARMRQVLAAHPVDVLALQEVQIDAERGNQAHVLAEALAMPHVFYARAHEAPKKEGGEEGLAVLSRFPIRSARSVNMTRPRGSTDLNHRVFIHVELAVPAARLGLASTATEQPLHVLAAHWTYDTSGQCMAARQMLAYADALPPDAPVVMLGDFNIYLGFEYPMDLLTLDMPESLRDSPLNPCNAPDNAASGGAGKKNGQKAPPAPPSAPPLHSAAYPPFFDAFARAHPLEEGWTFTNFELGEDADLRQQATRPDRVLVRAPPHWAVRDAYVFADESDGRINDKLYASDHRALFISLVPRAQGDTVAARQHWLRTQRPLDFVAQPAGVQNTVKLADASLTALEFYLKQPTGPPLLLEKFKAGQAITLQLHTPHYPSRIEVHSGGPDCGGYDAVLDAQVSATFDDPLYFPHFQRRAVLGALKEGKMTWIAPLAPLEKQNLVLFVAIRILKVPPGGRACISRFVVW